MIHSVLKAIDILEVFSSDEPRLTLAEISERMGCPRARRITCLTRSHPAVMSKAPGRALCVGTGHHRADPGRAHQRGTARRRAAPLLRVGRSLPRIGLSHCAGRRLRAYIYAVESSDRLRAPQRGRRPRASALYVGGQGHVERARTGGSQGDLGAGGHAALHRHDHRRADPASARTARLRRQGYAIDRSEHEVNYYCIGAPIFDRRRRSSPCSVSGSNPEILGAWLPDLSSRGLCSAGDLHYMGHLPARGCDRQFFGRQETVSEQLGTVAGAVCGSGRLSRQVNAVTIRRCA